jgi:acyl-homoserine-lactone acylase
MPLASSAQPPAGYHYRAETLWDSWGVPHIYGNDDASLFYAFGWAQMESHADLLLRLYGQARGRAAEYWGASYIGSDQTVRMMGFPDHAQQWYASQSPEFRQYLDAFAAGINDYAKQHPNQIASDLKVVLPVQATDVLAHLQRLLFVFLVGNNICNNVINTGVSLGSNAWAIAPSHSTDGKAMLLANPHLPWSNLFTLYEAHLNSPDIDAYGATFVGLPVLIFAFNNYLGWTHTINTIDGCTLYQLTLSGKGYLFDQQERAFETQTQILRVRQANGTLQEQPFVVRRSVQGPIIVTHNHTFALRVVGVDQFPTYGALQEWWDMAKVRNLDEFETVLQRLQIPMFTVIYADRDGHILSLFNGQVPVRMKGDWIFWSNIVPGDTSDTLWTSIHRYSELPKVIDAQNGWVQNSNSPPWLTTFPAELNPGTYPAYMAPQYMSMREQRGVEMLRENLYISFDKMIQDKFSTHVEMADRILPDLIDAVRLYGDAPANRAADVLQAWDRSTDANSRGAVLFYQWVNEVLKPGATLSDLFAVPWEATDPLTTPNSLINPLSAVKNLDAAAAYVQSQWGSLDVPWGDIFRLQRGKIDIPANGGPGDPFGIFNALYFSPTHNQQFIAIDGDSYIAAVEFTSPVRAMVLTTYGNSSQPGSVHNGDQLELYAHKQLRPAWFTRSEIEAHLASREVFDVTR